MVKGMVRGDHASYVNTYGASLLIRPGSCFQDLDGLTPALDGDPVALVSDAMARAFRSGVLATPYGFGWGPIGFGIRRLALRQYTTTYNKERFKHMSDVTFHFAPDGDDLNDGQSAEEPKQSIAAMITALNASPPTVGATFLLAPGHYAEAIPNVTFPRLNMICPNGAAEFYTQESPTWTLRNGTDSTYEWDSGVARTAWSIIDRTNNDEYGVPVRLTPRATIEEVIAEPNTFLYAFSAVSRIHLHDGREPDSHVQVFNGASPWDQTTGIRLYLENIRFLGWNEDISITNATFNAVDCWFNYSLVSRNGLTFSTATFSTLFNCIAAYNAYDGFSYNGSSRGAEINCKGVWNGYVGGNTNDNGSTCHDAAIVIRVNGTYRYNGDRNIHDVGSAQSWNVGCLIGDSQNPSTDIWVSANVLAGIVGTADATKVWLEGCASAGGSGGDLGAYSNARIELFECTGFDLRETEDSGVIDDASGTEVWRTGYHAYQTVEASRPTYRESGGVSWLEFDGVNDSLDVDLYGLGSRAFHGLIAASYAPDDTTSTGYLFYAATSGSLTSQGLSLLLNVTSQDRLIIGGNNSINVISASATRKTVLANIDRLNESGVAGWDGAYGAAGMGTFNNVPEKLKIGSRVAAAFYNGSLYGLHVQFGDIDDATRDAIAESVN